MGAGEPRFGVLGPLLIEVDGEPVPPPGSAVVRGRLGVLLLAAGRPPPAQLPPAIADFTGRDTHVDRLHRALAQTGTPPSR